MGKYDSIIRAIFQERYVEGATSILFERELLSQKATQLGITPPKNLGDIVYSYKYRNPIPDEIAQTAPAGHYWRIRNVESVSMSLCWQRESSLSNLMQCWQQSKSRMVHRALSRNIAFLMNKPFWPLCDTIV